MKDKILFSRKAQCGKKNFIITQITIKVSFSCMFNRVIPGLCPLRWIGEKQAHINEICVTNS